MTGSPDERCEGRSTFVLTAEDQHKLYSLFLPSARRIRNVARQFLLRSLGETADDCVHDTFLEFAKQAALGKCRCLGHKRPAELSEEELPAYARKCRPYLMAIAMNKCRNYHRQLKQHAAPDSQAGPLAGDCSDPINEAIQEENRQLTRAALARLDKPLRTVLILRYYGQFKIIEIAEIVSIPEGTVKSRLDRAHECMRSMLRAQGMEEPLPEGHAVANVSRAG